MVTMIPNSNSHEARNPSWTGGSSVLAEFGSVQLEYKYLSEQLGDPVYAEKVFITTSTSQPNFIQGRKSDANSS